VTGRKLKPSEMDPVAVGAGVAGVAVARGELLVVDDLARDPRFSGRASGDRYLSRAFAVAPLRGADGPLGALCATDRADGARFSEDDVLLLRILAREIAAAWEPSAAGAGAVAADADVTLRLLPEAEPTHAERDAELVRRICDALTREVEPARVLGAAVAAVAEALPAAPVSVYFVDNASGELRREAQWQGDGPGDRAALPRTAGLTGMVLQTGRPVATDRPERDPRFDAASDTPEGGGAGPLLCVPLKLRGKTLGLLRAFPVEGASAAARTGEMIAAAMSAAVRNVLLYRSLLESIEDVARARREAPSGEPR
jgi:GAF domain-containing protein